MSGGVEWTDLAQRQVAGCCKHGNELWRMTYVGNPLTSWENVNFYEKFIFFISLH
jgi:hypothetical protein